MTGRQDTGAESGRILLHLALREEWEQTPEDYLPEAFKDDGFVHCSLRPQLLAVANRVFAGREDLVLLCIDPTLLRVDVRYEDLYGEGSEYPHVYGPIARAAIIRVCSFQPDENGLFADRLLQDVG